MAKRTCLPGGANRQWAKRVLAKKLRQAREGENLTFAQTGERVGRARSTIANYERGFACPSVATMHAYVAEFPQLADSWGTWGDATNKTPPTYGPAFAQLRRLCGMKQAAFAKMLGYAPGTVSRWERGVKLPAEEAVAVYRAAARKRGIDWGVEVERPEIEDLKMPAWRATRGWEGLP